MVKYRCMKENQQPISTGSWNENISWEFFIGDEVPDPALCTAVCCITVFQEKLILVRNKRGWEFPAGKMESGESAETAIIREVGEETGALIESPKIFGYKKLTALQPVSKPDQPDAFYPFPHSYVVFFYAEAADFKQTELADDALEIKLATLSEAQELLEPQGKYKNMLEFLSEQGLIKCQ